MKAGITAHKQFSVAKIDPRLYGSFIDGVIVWVPCLFLKRFIQTVKVVRQASLNGSLPIHDSHDSST
ncbi:hypothetical protein VPAL9027_02613 [Vibrio palustris]|uniref:Uncharacterized protein n=1 Tax=Vibrio palustris TaxID=1918946 RepID=A0A1R4B6X4_9VIBR|nr:hypothetical protein VPAL9027_02613 [Vibrio palustris]